jgi:hypothetical protein
MLQSLFLVGPAERLNLSKLLARTALFGLWKLIPTGRCIESDRQSNRYFKACRPKIRGADCAAVQANRLKGNG